MAQIPHVQPGEVIRSSFINTLIDAINAGTGGGPAPAGVLVPDVFGRTLSQAQSMLAQPSVNLALGTVLDAFGAVVDPNAAGSGLRFVLNASPSVGTRVPAGTAVHLMVAAVSTGPSTPAPTIIRTETATSVVTSTFRVGDTVVIVGTGFSVVTGQNVVTFDGIPAAVTADAANPTQRLLVNVPTGIPGGPVNPGDPSKPGVVLAVSTSGSTPATFSITVDPPSAVPVPNITNFTPSQQFVGSNVTINGSNFSNVVARNIVTLAGVNAPVISATPAQVVFTVPNLPGLPAPSGSSLAVAITLTVNDASNNPIGTDVSSTNLTVRRP